MNMIFDPFQCTDCCDYILLEVLTSKNRTNEKEEREQSVKLSAVHVPQPLPKCYRNYKLPNKNLEDFKEIETSAILLIRFILRLAEILYC